MFMGELITKLGVDTRDLAKAQVAMKNFGNQATSVFSKISKSIFSLKGLITGLVSGLAIRKISKSFMEAAKETERFRIQLQTVLKDAEKGNKAFDWVVEFARVTPHLTRDVASAFTMLTAAGIDANDRLMKAMGDTAYVMNRNIQDVAQAYLSMETEVWRRLGIIIDRTGEKWKVKLGDMTIETEKNFDALREAVLVAMEQGFGGGMEKAKSSWSGAMAEMESIWWEFRKDIMGEGEGGPFDELIKKINEVRTAFSEWIQTEEYEEFIERWRSRIISAINAVIKSLKVLYENSELILGTFKALLALWAGMKIGKFILLFSDWATTSATLGKALVYATAGFQGLKAALIAATFNPATLPIIVAIGSLVVLLRQHNKLSKEAREEILKTHSVLGTGGGILKDLPAYASPIPPPTPGEYDETSWRNLSFRAQQVKDTISDTGIQVQQTVTSVSDAANITVDAVDRVTEAGERAMTVYERLKHQLDYVLAAEEYAWKYEAGPMPVPLRKEQEWDIAEMESAARIGRQIAEEMENVRQKTDDVGQSYADLVTKSDMWAKSLSDGIADAIVHGRSLIDVLAEIGRQLAKMLISKAFSGIFGGLFPTFHEGGVVGISNSKTLRTIHPKRYHSGGLIGSSEELAILEKGERVVPKESAAAVVINVLDKEELEKVTYEAMIKFPGAQIVTNHILRNVSERGAIAGVR